MKLNIKFIKGRTRVIWLIGEYAFKLPNYYSWKSFLKGLQESMFEREFYKTHSTSQLIFPVLWSIPGGWLNVMPRASKVFTEHTPELQVYFENVLSALKNNDPVEGFVLDVVEVHEPSNFGKVCGIIKCLDYGNGRNQGLNEYRIAWHSSKQ